jgi:predicted transcriptional regulator
MKKESIIENLLGSKWKIRVLKKIIEEKEVNISNLAKETSSNFKKVEQYLKLLNELEIIREKRLGKIRLIIVNEKSPIFSNLERMFRLVEGKYSS